MNASQRATTAARSGPDDHPARPATWTIVSAVLTIGLIADAAYLTWVHYRPAALICSVDGGCHTVQNSRYAMLGPVPVAALGLAMAVVILLLSVVRWRWPALTPAVSIALVGMLVGAVIYYGYLTHIELNVLNAICQWCVLSAALTVALLVTEGTGLWRQLDALDE
jgi:uncharacterized membrane protein